MQKLDRLGELADEFAQVVELSGRSRNTACRMICYYLCCCNFACFRRTRFLTKDKGRPCCSRERSRPDVIFGDLDQCRLVLGKTFGGRQFMIPSVPGRRQPKLDCMFFPATTGDEVTLDPEDPEQGLDTEAENLLAGEAKRKYL